MILLLEYLISLFHWLGNELLLQSSLFPLMGSLVGYFKGKRGFMQGDHLSPYEFVLVMKVFSKPMQQMVSNSASSNFVLMCRFEINPSLLCWWSDGFFGGWCSIPWINPRCITILQEAFKAECQIQWKMRLATVPLTSKQQILAVFQFKEGKLPVRYLGVRLISKRLPEKETFGG